MISRQPTQRRQISWVRVSEQSKKKTSHSNSQTRTRRRGRRQRKGTRIVVVSSSRFRKAQGMRRMNLVDLKLSNQRKSKVTYQYSWSLVETLEQVMRVAVTSKMESFSQSRSLFSIKDSFKMKLVKSTGSQRYRRIRILTTSR